MLEFNLAIPELNALVAWADLLPQKVEAELRRVMVSAVLDAEEEIANHTPVDTGRLRLALSSRVEGAGTDIRGVVELANVHYARYVEEGTRPHIIEARNARALAWQQGPAAYRIKSHRAQYRVMSGKKAGGLTGRKSVRTMLFARRVRHPGTRGAHMFREGTLAALPRIQSRFVAALRRVTKVK